MITIAEVQRLLDELDQPRSSAEHDRALTRIALDAGIEGPVEPLPAPGPDRTGGER